MAEHARAEVADFETAAVAPSNSRLDRLERPVTVNRWILERKLAPSAIPTNAVGLPLRKCPAAQTRSAA